MSIVIESELLSWVANEAEQIASGLDDGSMSPGVASRYLRNIARKIAAESESNYEELAEKVASDRRNAFPPAPNRLCLGDIGPIQRVVKSRRCWQMRVLDLETGEVRSRKKRLTKLEAAMVHEQWQAKRINALVFFVPDWAACSIEIKAKAATSA